FQAEEGIRDRNVNGVQTCALPIFLANVCCTFLQQGYFGETLHLETYPREIGHKSATLVTKIYKDEKKELIAKGESIVVYFDLKKQISLQIPEEIKEILLRYRREEYD